MHLFAGARPRPLRTTFPDVSRRRRCRFSPKPLPEFSRRGDRSQRLPAAGRFSAVNGSFKACPPLAGRHPDWGLRRFIPRHAAGLFRPSGFRGLPRLGGQAARSDGGFPAWPPAFEHAPIKMGGKGPPAAAATTYCASYNVGLRL